MRLITSTQLVLGVLLVPLGMLFSQNTPSSAATASATHSPTPPWPAPLTPVASEFPRINGAPVFGVRPDSPFLYSIPATGVRPMNFAAEGLPEGLVLDAATGRITGKIAKTGTYKVVLIAKNSKGEARKLFKIIVGETITLTPAMGWNSWNCFAGHVDQEKVLGAAKALVASGLDQHGWTYINIDDTWQGDRNSPDHALQPNLIKFPDMQALCNAIHGLGLKAGIYSTPWTISYAHRTGGSSVNPDGARDTNDYGQTHKNSKQLPYDVGPYSFAKQDAAQWAKWGMDYLKYDWNPIEKPQVVEMHEALRATGRDIILSLSNSTPFETIADVAPDAESWRTTGDIIDTWRSMSGIGFSQQKWIPFQSPGHYNDPDMLVVGWVGWGTPHPTRLTPDEQYTHLSLWCLLSAPLILGCDLERLDPFTIGLLCNDEVIAIDQDPLVKPARCVTPTGDGKVYVKELADGTMAVGLFNSGNKPSSITLDWKQAGLTGAWNLRDLWRQKEIGKYSYQFTAEVAPHGVLLLKLSPVR